MPEPSQTDSSTESPALPKPHDPYIALRSRDYRFYAAGWITAVVGEQVTEVAVGWDIYQRTLNPMSLGWVGLITAIPVILLALPAGHLADRVNRRKIVMFTQLLWMICAASLAIISHRNGSIGAMYAVLFIAALSKSLGGPARSALLPMMVQPEAYSNAITWNSSGFQLAAMIGPALGGLIVGWNVPAAYFVGSIGALTYAAFLIFVRGRAQETSKREPATLKSLAAGVHFVFGTKIILATITLDLFAVLLGGATYLLPVFAKEILHVGGIGFGWLRAAPAIGALAMALTVAHLPPMKNAGRAMLLAVAAFGLATVVFGISTNFWLSFAMLLLTGAFDNISVVVRHTLVQVLTPDAMRGRVSAVNNVFIGSSNELGGFESGLTARLWGPVASVVAGGIGTMLVVAAVALRWPQVRKFGSLQDAAAAEKSE